MHSCPVKVLLSPYPRLCPAPHLAPSQKASIREFPHDSVATALRWSAPVTTCIVPIASPPATAANTLLGWSSA